MEDQDLYNKIEEVNALEDLPKFVMCGYLKRKLKPEIKSEKFSQQIFILQTKGKMGMDYKFMCVNTRIPQLLKANEGDVIEIWFNLHGKAFKTPDGLDETYTPITGQVYEVNVIQRANSQQ